jgi:flagellar hook assembly protein FlgD
VSTSRSTSAAVPVAVRIYDARGRLVKSLDARTYPPGRHLVHWNGTGEDGYRPRPGVYFARLVLGTTEFTGKMVLLR